MLTEVRRSIPWSLLGSLALMCVATAIFSVQSPGSAGSAGPIEKGWEVGTYPGSGKYPDSQLFSKGSDLFLSTYDLWNLTSSPATLTGAAIVNGGGCQEVPIETMATDLLLSKPDSPNTPFGYGSIHVLGLNLVPVDGFRLSPHSKAPDFVVFSFADPRDCQLRVDDFQIQYIVKGVAGVETLPTGGVIFRPTKLSGYFGIDHPVK
jgi:hypothetical protein